MEVLSPSTQRVDVSLKLAGYFKLPSVMHYLIVDPTQPSVVHHARGSGDTILTRIVTAESLIRRASPSRSAKFTMRRNGLGAPAR